MIIILGISAFLFILALSVLLLLPLPLLTYRQSGVEVLLGVVVKIESVATASGVVKVGVQQSIEVDRNSVGSSVLFVGATITSFVYFRTYQALPKVGDTISVSYINRFHRLAGASFNWVKSWADTNEPIPSGGKIVMIHSQV